MAQGSSNTGRMVLQQRERAPGTRLLMSSKPHTARKGFRWDKPPLRLLSLHCARVHGTGAGVGVGMGAGGEVGWNFVGAGVGVGRASTQV